VAAMSDATPGICGLVQPLVHKPFLACELHEQFLTTAKRPSGGIRSLGFQTLEAGVLRQYDEVVCWRLVPC
jgi:hypothetical protein